MLMKKVKRIVVMFGRKFGAHKPVFRKLFFAIGHILAAKDTEREHLFWRKLRLEVGMKIPSCRFGKLVFVTLLEFVVYFYNLFSHR